MDIKTYKAHLTKTFRKYFLSYIAILLIPLITGFISYHISIDVTESSSIENNLMVLNQSKDILDQRMIEVDRFTRQMATNYDLTNLLNQDLTGESYNVYGLSKTVKDISNYVYTNDFLQDFYIYLKNYDVIISPNSVFFRLEHFYEVNNYQHLSMDQWKTEILEDYHQRTVLPLTPYTSNNRNSSVITYIQSLPLNSNNSPKGVAVITIDHRKLSDTLSRISSNSGGWAYIADSKGNTIALAGIDESQVNNLNLDIDKHDSTSFMRDNTLIISTRSDYNGWLYVAGIPNKALMEKANVIKYTTWFVTIGTLCIGLLLCLFLAYKNSAPMNRLIKILNDEQIGNKETDINGKDDYDFVQGNIACLISNHKLLQEELTKQIPILKDTFLKRLIYGEFQSVQTIDAAAAQAEVILNGKYGYVGIVQINGYGEMGSKEIFNELNATRLIIKQTLHEIDPKLYMTDIGFDKIVIIFNFTQVPETGVVHINETMEFLIHTMKENYKISFTISFGSLFTNLLDISKSYNDANATREYTYLLNDKSIFWYEDSKKETDMYYYPIDIEIRLLNALKIGEEEESKRILAQIFEQNFQNKDLSVDLAQQLLIELKATVLKSFDTASIFQNTSESEELKNIVISIQLSDGLDHVIDTMNHVISRYCALMVTKKRKADCDTLQAILDYLEQNYHNPNLTLYIVAEHVGRPEKYISQIFKEQTGEYIAEYIEKIRIKKASELLITTDITIEEISLDVGYNSPHSFRRAFKRVFNVTPNMYRKTVNQRTSS